MFTGDGFSLNSGFRNILCSQEMDSVLFQVSQKFCVHQRILYSAIFRETISCKLYIGIKLVPHSVSAYTVYSSNLVICFKVGSAGAPAPSAAPSFFP